MTNLPIVPVSEFNEPGEETRCVECDRTLADNEWAVYFGDGHCCETCAEERAKTTEQKAKQFAKENCKITKMLPKYDPKQEFRCTPEEYDAGSRESYSRNSHLCDCRHNCTNYDDLIKPLDKDDLKDQIAYEAIRIRIDELLTVQIETDGDDDDLDENDAD